MTVGNIVAFLFLTVASEPIQLTMGNAQFDALLAGYIRKVIWSRLQENRRWGSFTYFLELPPGPYKNMVVYFIDSENKLSKQRITDLFQGLHMPGKLAKHFRYVTLGG